MKNKTIILSLGILAAALIGSFLLLSKNSVSPVGPATQEDGIVLFYGTGCPHCALVNDFIQKNGIKEKVAFKEKEVYCNDIWDETNRRRWRQVSEKEGDELKKQLAEERARKIR